MAEYPDWNRLCESADGAPRSRQAAAFLDWLDTRLAAPEVKAPTAVAGGLTPPFRQALTRMLAGDLVAAGVLPQLELLVLTALFHVSRGRRVLVLSNVPAAPSLVRSLTRFVEAVAPVSPAASGHVFGRPEKKMSAIREADIVLGDCMQLFELFRGGKTFPEDRPLVALFAEADLCLYDSRLAFFDRGALQAAAAVYHITGKRRPWQDRDAIMDLADLAGRFEEIGGAASYLTPRIAGELTRAYREHIPGKIRPDPGARFSALAFKTWGEKQELLYRDLLTAEGDCLVFYVREPLRQLMQDELRKRGQESVAIPNPRDLRTFLAMKSDKKRVGFYRGLPTVLTAPPETRLPMDVFIAEHYQFEHQHGKIRAFIDRELTPPRRPYLYFSLEDEMFEVYAEEDAFSGAFDLIAFTERYDKRRRVRRVMARSILRRIYALRRAALTEENPVFTMINPQAPKSAKRSRSRGRKTVGKRLEGLCFCGSGKPFRECHGKPRSAAKPATS